MSPGQQCPCSKPLGMNNRLITSLPITAESALCAEGSVENVKVGFEGKQGLVAFL